MTFDPAANPVLTGLGAGSLVLLAKMIVSRVIGNEGEKSIPAQFKEVNEKLASIDTTLKLMKNDRKHESKWIEELYDDFWDHIDQHHGTASGTSASKKRKPRKQVEDEDAE